MKEMYKLQIIGWDYSPEWQAPDFIYSPVIPRIGEKISIPWTCTKDNSRYKKGYVDNSELDEVIDVLYHFNNNSQLDYITIYIKGAEQ